MSHKAARWRSGWQPNGTKALKALVRNLFTLSAALACRYKPALCGIKQKWKNLLNCAQVRGDGEIRYHRALLCKMKLSVDWTAQNTANLVDWQQTRTQKDIVSGLFYKVRPQAHNTQTVICQAESMFWHLWRVKSRVWKLELTFHHL